MRLRTIFALAGIRRVPVGRIAALLLVALALAACAPKAPPLSGTIAPARLPDTELPPGHRLIVFRWDYADNDFRARGDGAARVAPPDSVRLDLFLGGSVGGGGRAILVGDTLSTPDGGQIRNYLPPVPLLWGALGRLHVPAHPDTVARIDGDTLRVEIGRDPAWRATFIARQLRRLEVVDGGRIPQWVTRDSAGHIHYEHARARRRLDLTIVRVDTVAAFDPAIWR
jgi:hypothetical protein